jgi:hypothetical protein
MAEFLTGFADIAALVLWAAFMGGYLAYGNRLHAPAGRALAVMSTGYMLVVLTDALRYPFGLTAASSAFFAWFQAAAIGIGCMGTASLIWLLVRANGRWPWQPPK